MIEDFKERRELMLLDFVGESKNSVEVKSRNNVDGGGGEEEIMIKEGEWN